MPQCQAIHCTNRQGNGKKGFFRFPKPEKGIEERKLCKKWIDNLKNGKLRIETFRDYKHMVVCEDHFTEDCFSGSFSSTVAASLNFGHKRKTLKKGSVPNVIGSKPGSSNSFGIVSARKSADSLNFKRKKAQLKTECHQSRTKKALCDLFLSKEDPLSAVHMIDSEENMLQEETEWYTATPLSGVAVPENLVSEDVFMEKNTDSFGLNGEMYAIKSSCGHPCVYCQSVVTDVSCDHNYAKRYTVNQVNQGTQTEWDDEANKFEAVPHSTPKKKGPGISLPRLDSHGLDNGNELMDLSFVSGTYRDDSNDHTFATDVESCVSDADSLIDNEPQINDIVAENKYIVFESMLDEILLRLRCPASSCNSPVDPDDLRKRVAEDGLFSCKVFCVSGHLILDWKSQPILGKMPAANLLCSAATLFCGQTFTHIAEFCKFMNLKFMAESTFHRIQREQVMPVVLDAWSSMQSEMLADIRKSNRPLRLAGDGRCDSPGFSAKYCTYSIMDMETSAILTFVVVKVTETGSSSRMEVEGFRRCMLFLLDQGFRIEVMATDRHTSVRSVMKKEFSETRHQFDVWHLGKSIKKKLTAKGNEDLSPWIKAVVNHLWWSASHCDGDADWMEESWLSIIHHTVNEHQFPGTKITECLHRPLDPEISRKKKWLKRGDKAHNALKEVVLNKLVRKDIRQLTEFCHTGKLEVFHSLMLKYCPKRQEFDDDQMKTRTALAVMDHVHSLGRQQKVYSCGEKIFRQTFSKLTGEWTVKPVYEDKNFMWVFKLMNKVVNQKEVQLFPPTEVKKTGNIAKKPAPSKIELIQNLKSRFGSVSKPIWKF